MGVAASGKPADASQPVQPSRSCLPAWAYLLIVVAACAVVAFWASIKAGIVAGWAWVKSRFRRKPVEPKP